MIFIRLVKNLQLVIREHNIIQNCVSVISEPPTGPEATSTNAIGRNGEPAENEEAKGNTNPNARNKPANQSPAFIPTTGEDQAGRPITRAYKTSALASGNLTSV